MWVIPNSVFSRTVLLNITRKNREWRFFEQLLVRVQDVHKVRGLGVWGLVGLGFRGLMVVVVVG